MCSLTVYSLNGTLSSPNYRYPYLSVQNCSWRFHDHGDGYKITFTKKHLDRSNCKQQRLAISSKSSEEIDVCSSKFPIHLKSRDVLVEFQSKGNSYNFTEFEMEYVVQG